MHKLYGTTCVIVILLLSLILIQLMRVENMLLQWRPVQSHHYQKGAFQWDVVTDNVQITDAIENAIKGVQDGKR